MKFKFLIASIAFFTATANAGLIDRGNGMIYDDVQDITWLQDANYAMTSGYDADGLMYWQEAIDWADQLTVGGYDGWRLFDAAPDDDSCSQGNERYAIHFGANCLGVELGHLFYNDFGLTQDQLITSTVGDAEYDLFTNVQSDRYWSGTNHEVSSNFAWTLSGYGDKSGYQKNTNRHYAWAVLDGDVASVPEPSTLAIFALGMIGLASRRFKKQ
jgi:hypothetical protein